MDTYGIEVNFPEAFGEMDEAFQRYVLSVVAFGVKVVVDNGAVTIERWAKICEQEGMPEPMREFVLDAIRGDMEASPGVLCFSSSESERN